MAHIKKFLICGIVAGPLFLTVAFLEGITRAGYNSFRDPISSLAIGQYGWMQMINFFATGALLLLFAYGLRQAFRVSSPKSFWGPVLIGLAAIGFIGAGVFATDPIPGYPTDFPLSQLPHTIHGGLHNFFSLFVFVGLPIASFVFARYFMRLGRRAWATYSLLSGIGMLMFFTIMAFCIATSISTGEVVTLTYVGLLQRITLIIIFLWVTLLAVNIVKINKTKP